MPRPRKKPPVKIDLTGTPVLDWVDSLETPKTACFFCGSEDVISAQRSPRGRVLLCRDCQGDALFVIAECWYEEMTGEYDPEMMTEIEKRMPRVLTWEEQPAVYDQGGSIPSRGTKEELEMKEEVAARLRIILDLRKKMGVSFDECKEVLEEVDWDRDAAMNRLRRRSYPMPYSGDLDGPSVPPIHLDDERPLVGDGSPSVPPIHLD